MGQRHQIYIVSKSKKQYSAIGAFHHQWCYGLRAASNVIRLVNIIKSIKTAHDGWSSYVLRDSREIDVITKSVYGLSLDQKSVSIVHNESEYLIDSESNQILPSQGDNNDGCTLIVIDEDKKEVRACLFAFQGVEGQHGQVINYKSYTPNQYAEFYYLKNEIKEAQTCKSLEALELLKEVKKISQVEFNKITAFDRKDKII